jgi:MGT family glycosyltransferase
MSKVVFLGLPAIGHINPTVGVVKELIARGEEVIYYNTPEFRLRIDDMGAEFRAYPFETAQSGNEIDGWDETLDNMKIDGIHTLNPLGRHIMGKMTFYLNIMNHPTFDLRKELAALRPDYIIHDSCAYWGKVLAKQLNIPAVNSVTTFAYCDQMLERYPEFVVREILEFPGLSADSSSTGKVLRRISLMIGNLLKIADFDCIDMSFSQEALNIVYTSREFQWHGEVFDTAFKFAGPSLYPRNDSGQFPLDRLAGSDLIYISLGTLLHNQDFYRKCFAAFGDSGTQVVLNTGNIHPEDLGSIPGNFIVSDFVPQLDILKRARLFITHGGMNGVNEALYFNVPLLVIPQRWDQYLVANRIAELGVGINMKNMEFNTRELYQAAEQIFTNDIYRRQSRIIGESLRSTGSYKQAADEIFQFKMEKGIK